MAKVGTKVGTKCRVLTQIPLQHWLHLLMAEQLSTLWAADPMAGFTQDGGVYVATCNAQSVAAIGIGGPRVATFLDNPFGGLAMQAFGC